MPSKSATSTALHAVGDTFDLMQKLWGMATGPTPANLATLARMPQRLPAMIAPTVDVEELDKRITDLRAVEQWLELNASMLRTTIQTLEVQRATITTLKGIGGAMLAPVLGGKAEAPIAPRAVPHVNPLPGVPPELMTPQPFAAPRRAKPKASKKGRARPARKSPVAAAGMPALGDDALNPTAWWQTLQDQFTRIAATAAETPAAALKATARASAKALKTTAATAATAATLPIAAAAAAAPTIRKATPRRRARKA